MTIPFEKLKARLLHNPKVKAEYHALAPEFEIAAELLRARLRAGLSQADLAARMRTSQSTIARLESGQTLPSTKTLLRYAEATGKQIPRAAVGGLMPFLAPLGVVGAIGRVSLVHAFTTGRSQMTRLPFDPARVVRRRTSRPARW